MSDNLTEEDKEYFLRYSRSIPDDYVLTKKVVNEMRKNDEEFYWWFIMVILKIIALFILSLIFMYNRLY